MPIYYFHLYNDEIIIDEQGQELADREAAQAVAQANAREMACAEVMAGSLNLAHRIDVADKTGDVLSTVRFGELSPSRCPKSASARLTAFHPKQT